MLPEKPGYMIDNGTRYIVEIGYPDKHIVVQKRIYKKNHKDINVLDYRLYIKNVNPSRKFPLNEFPFVPTQKAVWFPLDKPFDCVNGYIDSPIRRVFDITKYEIQMYNLKLHDDYDELDYLTLKI